MAYTPPMCGGHLPGSIVFPATKRQRDASSETDSEKMDCSAFSATSAVNSFFSAERLPTCLLNAGLTQAMPRSFIFWSREG